jgi:hypothetical protein
MGKERDLAWWRIPSWAPVTPRILTTGLVFGYPEIWPTTLAWLQLRRSGHVPAVSLMPFLEDAWSRGVLRTVGGVYQFRHATLQDQLADQTTPDSAVSRVS